jgi:hypothetical protein
MARTFGHGESKSITMKESAADKHVSSLHQRVFVVVAVVVVVLLLLFPVVLMPKNESTTRNSLFLSTKIQQPFFQKTSSKFLWPHCYILKLLNFPPPRCSEKEKTSDHGVFWRRYCSTNLHQHIIH